LNFRSKLLFVSLVVTHDLPKVAVPVRSKDKRNVVSVLESAAENPKSTNDGRSEGIPINRILNLTRERNFSGHVTNGCGSILVF
jgi:hypothetical protein